MVTASTALLSAYALSPTALIALTEKLYAVAGCRPVTVKDATPRGKTSAYRKPGERSQRYLSAKGGSERGEEEAPSGSTAPNLMRNLSCRPPLKPGIHSRVTESWVKLTSRNEDGGSGKPDGEGRKNRSEKRKTSPNTCLTSALGVTEWRQSSDYSLSAEIIDEARRLRIVLPL